MATPIPPTINFQPYPGAPPGVYCNAVQILFSPWEFNLELAQLAPEATLQAPPATLGQTSEAAITDLQIFKHVVSRVVMSPQHTKALLAVLRQNIDKYEEQFGEIPVIEVPGTSQGNEGKA